MQTTSILFNQSARCLFESPECTKFFVFFVDLSTCNDDCRLNFSKSHNVYSSLKCKWSRRHESWQRSWIRMQNVDKVKELKALILKDECLKEQSQSSDDDDCNWFRRFSSIKIIKSWWIQS